MYDRLVRVNLERLARINSMLHLLSKMRSTPAVREAIRGLNGAQDVAEVVKSIAGGLRDQEREFEERSKGLWSTIPPRFYADGMGTPEEFLKLLAGDRKRRG